jgi:hypothetical protein
MANKELAKIIEQNIKEITEVWMRAVRTDKRIDSDAALSRSQLRDHVPAVIEELCELIRGHETPDEANTLEGRVKVFLRLQQGYLGRDLAREVSLLRGALLDFLKVRCCESFNADLRIFYPTARIVNLYMDEMLRNAISAYSEVEELPQQMGEPNLN